MTENWSHWYFRNEFSIRGNVMFQQLSVFGASRKLLPAPNKGITMPMSEIKQWFDAYITKDIKSKYAISKA